MFGFFKKLAGGDKKGFSYKKMAKRVREEMQSWAVANPDCEQEKDSMYLTFAVQPRNLANSHGYAARCLFTDTGMFNVQFFYRGKKTGANLTVDQALEGVMIPNVVAAERLCAQYNDEKTILKAKIEDRRLQLVFFAGVSGVDAVQNEEDLERILREIWICINSEKTLRLVNALGV